MLYTLWTSRSPTSAPGYGSRHIPDNPPILLRMKNKRKLRSLNHYERGCVKTAYNSMDVVAALPPLVIGTDVPPKPVPLTISYALAHFTKLIFGPRPTWDNTSCSNPCLKDPLREIQPPMFSSPSRAR